MFPLLALLSLWATSAVCMTGDETSRLRSDTRDLFYHGFDNYMLHAFPEDELSPISCRPRTRNRDDPADWGVNDALGNYSLTLIDSLSTLAILVSREQGKSKRDPLRDFQDGIKSLVDLYGDGTENKPCGSRACGFDVDSKVQVFETNIRGVGGLLSAHLFAIGELPIIGYKPVFKQGRTPGIRWNNGFVYNNQLLNLAHDLGKRLLPAFGTSTGIPYPRVNLRTGIPFYQDPENGFCRLDGTHVPRDITENCAAGAGSLVLEFSTLSRLTGDMRFEKLAKEAFWAIWYRRSAIDLLGNGIDAENGHWTIPPLSAIGAGIDSFFEYSLKSAILLSNVPFNASTYETDAPASFWQTWEQAHAAVKHHVYRGKFSEKHPYYSVVDTATGASRYGWIDNLSAYYPGLLVLAGELNEAIESHLLFSALWTRYGALPERWHTGNAQIERGFEHWVGRPEFMESTFYLYQATKDPFYLHVGEMTLRDIRRRCWTKCGWADLSDVRTGKQRDRMESFFLGETAKYLYLLFTPDHPLNSIDRPWVFTTEGHPLVIPDQHRHAEPFNGLIKQAIRRVEVKFGQEAEVPRTCQAPPPALPLTVSSIVNRSDFFHPVAFTQLHKVQVSNVISSALLEASRNSPGISVADIRGPSNHSLYPWTLPNSLTRGPYGFSSAIVARPVSTLTFPALGSTPAEVEKGLMPLGAVVRALEGFLINSLSNMRLTMIQEPKITPLPNGDNPFVTQEPEFRIQSIANMGLGKDEKVLISDKAMQGVNPSDPHFTRVKDLEMVDLVLDVPSLPEGEDGLVPMEVEDLVNGTFDKLMGKLEAKIGSILSSYNANHIQGYRPSSTTAGSRPIVSRRLIPAILPTGIGAAPLPALMDDSIPSGTSGGALPFSTIFYLDDTLCNYRLPIGIAKRYNILVIERGECSFSDKLAKISSYAPGAEALQLVIVISKSQDFDNDRNPNQYGLIRPLLDQVQFTPNNFERRNPIAMVMVDGTRETVHALRSVATAIGTFDENGKLMEAQKSVGSRDGKFSPGSGLGVKRRYSFESMGVPIANLLML